ncbi:putative transcription factor, K-box [Helianthus debilis subsp. tardiflorus]
MVCELGDCLENVGFEELLDLERESQEAVYIIRERKLKVIGNKLETCKKKVRSAQDVYKKLMHEFVSPHNFNCRTTMSNELLFQNFKNNIKNYCCCSITYNFNVIRLCIMV